VIVSTSLLDFTVRVGQGERDDPRHLLCLLSAVVARAVRPVI
jgi:hypothetical protein